MGFYDLPKDIRDELKTLIQDEISKEIYDDKFIKIFDYFSDSDTYIRKAAYIAVGKIYRMDIEIKKQIVSALKELYKNSNEKVRQTVINAAGEIGMTDFESIEEILHTGIFDEHHSVKNAVIGSLKKIGEVNPQPAIGFSKKYIHHPDAEVRRQAVHGLELRGRTHPEEILPLLKELQNETTARVKNMIIHVIGQISYKKGCLEKVLNELKTWENKSIVKKSLNEIIDVHENYKEFSALTTEEVKQITAGFFKGN